MATTVTGSIKLMVQLADVRSAVTGSSKEGGSRSISGDYSWTIASGTSASQADKVWADTRTVATGATDSLDLSGALTNAFGETVTFAKIRAVALYAAAANTTTLTISRVATAGFQLLGADGQALAPLSAGGFFCFADPAAGFTVTNADTDVMSVVNSSGASASYEVIVIGTSA